MTLEERTKQIAKQRGGPKLKYCQDAERDCIHHSSPNGLLTTVIVSRAGAYHGGAV